MSLFAPPRCYGTPDELRKLVDEAHSRNIAVVLIIVSTAPMVVLTVLIIALTVLIIALRVLIIVLRVLIIVLRVPIVVLSTKGNDLVLFESADNPLV